MRNQYAAILSLLLGTVETLANAGEAKPIDLSEIETREHVLHDGKTIRVPKDAVMVPGTPIMFRQDQLTKYKKTKESLNTLGYVDAPRGAQPIADKLLKLARSNHRSVDVGSLASAKKLREGHFLKTQEVELAKLQIGQVDSRYLNSNSESYISVRSSEIIRVYSNTKFGNVFINQMKAAKMKTLDPDPAFFVQFGEAKGYRSVIRYANDEMMTLYALSSGPNSFTIELRENEVGANDHELEAFLVGLVSDVEF